MSQLWYYKRDSQECGPVAAADLKLLADAKRLLPMDQVRKDGSTRWRPARSVRGLFDDGPKPGLWARAVEVWGVGGLIASCLAILIVAGGGAILTIALHNSAAASSPPPVAATAGPALPAPASPVAGASKSEEPRPKHVLDALREMHEACAELKGGEHAHDGPVEEASHALDRSIDQTERALRAAGLSVETTVADLDANKKYSDHPHLREALNDILEAKIEMRDAHFNFGDERERTVRELDFAAERIEAALKYSHE